MHAHHSLLRNGLDAAHKEWGHTTDVRHDDGALGDKVAVVYVVLLDAVGAPRGVFRPSR